MAKRTKGGHVSLWAILLLPSTVGAFIGRSRLPTRNQQPVDTSRLHNAAPFSIDFNGNDNYFGELTVVQAIQSRFACKAFQRYDKTSPQSEEASESDPAVVQTAMRLLNMARLSPSSFNTQPYRVILVHSKAQKLALSRSCLGPNARRVLDADCTAVFLADKQVLRTILPQTSLWKRLSRKSATQELKRGQGPPTNRRNLLYISLFSSGYPLPRVLATLFGFCVRTAVSILDFLARPFKQYIPLLPLPTLSSSETWATKQSSLVAMSYMLLCASAGLATIPMEGLHAPSLRRALNVPRRYRQRYAVPLIVATGRAVQKVDDLPRNQTQEAELDQHNISNDHLQDLIEERRYPTENVLFADSWNETLPLLGVVDA